MSSTPITPTSTQFDLLREKRQELNLPDPVEGAVQGRQQLVKGVAIGAALVGVSLGVAALVFLRAVMVSGSIDRLSTVEAEVQLFETQLNSARAKLKGVDKANQDLVEGLKAVRSGSAVLRDLQIRVPEGIQLTAATEEGSGYRLKGLSRDPEAFGRINAFQLQLKRSPLLDPNGVTMVKSSREAAPAAQPAGAASAAGSAPGPVSFEMVVKFRPSISPAAEKQILGELGSEGLVRRLDLLQKEGLLR
ncbi:MAG: PilN domain-containing protein [Cyanobium sp.]